MGQHLSPRYSQVILVSGYPVLTAVNWSQHWCPMDVCIISFSVLSNKLESMRLNVDRDLVKQLVSGQLPNKSRHLDELTHEPSIWQCDTSQWLSCFDSCQLTILGMANVKDVDLPRHAWDTPPFLLIVSPTLPVQSVDAYVRSVSHVTTKRKEVDHILWVWGSVPRALRVRGSPAMMFSVKSVDSAYTEIKVCRALWKRCCYHKQTKG